MDSGGGARRGGAGADNRSGIVISFLAVSCCILVLPIGLAEPIAPCPPGAHPHGVLSCFESFRLRGIDIWRATLPKRPVMRCRCRCGSQMLVREANPNTTRPLEFIHLPKNAGTSIERTLSFYLHYRTGRQYLEHAESILRKRGLPSSVLLQEEGSPYPLGPERCIQMWHSPPLRFVHNSFAVIRHPYERFVSRACYFSSPWFPTTTRDRDREPSPSPAEACSLFQRYARKTLTSFDVVNTAWDVIGERSRAKECHRFPQWAYARHAEWLVPMSSLDAGVNALLREYGIWHGREDFRLRRANTAQDFLRKKKRHKDRQVCPANVLRGECFTRDILDLVDAHEAQIWPFFADEPWPRSWTRLNATNRSRLSGESSSSDVGSPYAKPIPLIAKEGALSSCEPTGLLSAFVARALVLNATTPRKRNPIASRRIAARARSELKIRGTMMVQS